MPKKFYIKLYLEILDDPKMGMMSDKEYRNTIEFFLLAGTVDNEGLLPSLDEMAWKLRRPTDEILLSLQALINDDLVHETKEGWVVTKFGARQAPIKSTDRVRQYRRGKEHYPRDIKTQKSIYKNLPETAGIYLIEFKDSKMVYIGASKNIRQRIRSHLTEMKTLRENRMHDLYLKSGFDNIKVSVLEQVDNPKDLSVIEKKYFDKYKNETLINYENETGQHRSWNENETNRFIELKLESELNKEQEAGKKQPANLDDWLVILKKDKNKQAVLMVMFETLYPSATETPEYAYLGRVAKNVGGAGRLAQLLWECSSKKITGDVMRFIQAYHKNNSHKEPKKKGPKTDPAETLNQLEKLEDK